MRIAAIDFLNPAPLMWNFEHGAEREELLSRYTLRSMTPAACADALRTGEADLGLVPAGAFALDPELTLLPGSAIASLGSIRSILLVVRAGAGARERQDAEPDLQPPAAEELAHIHSVALDTSSRTSALYTQILFRKYWRREGVQFAAHPPELEQMLAHADAALLIGDPALLALRDAQAREQKTGERLRYVDLGAVWRAATGTAWVSAFWAARTRALEGRNVRALVGDLDRSREAGLAHIPELAAIWAPRLGLPRATVSTYLAHNIYYRLDGEVRAGLLRFWQDAVELRLLPAVPAVENL